MNARELKQLLAAGPLVIEFGEKIETLEAYPDAKMRAHLVSVVLQQPDDVAVLSVDYSAFDEFNKAFEQSNYFDKGGQPTLTARQAGYYRLQDNLYVMADDDLEAGILSLLPTNSLALFNEFLSSGQASYVSWLEEKLLAARAPLEGVDDKSGNHQ
jgi:hypothetical protein